MRSMLFSGTAENTSEVGCQGGGGPWTSSHGPLFLRFSSEKNGFPDAPRYDTANPSSRGAGLIHSFFEGPPMLALPKGLIRVRRWAQRITCHPAHSRPRSTQLFVES